MDPKWGPHIQDHPSRNRIDIENPPVDLVVRLRSYENKVHLGIDSTWVSLKILGNKICNIDNLMVHY